MFFNFIRESVIYKVDTPFESYYKIIWHEEFCKGVVIVFNYC